MSRLWGCETISILKSGVENQDRIHNFSDLVEEERNSEVLNLVFA